MKANLLCLFLLPALCFANTCMFVSPSPLSTSCEMLSSGGGCTVCKSGYDLLLNSCYSPCPSGWTQLMPGYCVNSTIINNHQNFTLCPTNQTMELTAGAG